ncbi:cell wall hydrolase [Bacillaceae bacterium IKA-2]|nr:cell wall hydrolase [Bacillaceae bacterium IKA-2]
MNKVIISFTLAISLFLYGTITAEAAVTKHSVQSGDSLWKIANNYGISINEIKTTNNKKSNVVYIGERLTIPASVTAYEKRLLAQIVTAEAKGEPYAGQVAVAVVILNRVNSSKFPNTIHDVIYQTRQFEPVSNGTINNPATASAERAVDEALAFRGQGSGSLFFYNPKIATSHWIATRQHTITIGNHVFAK